MADRKIYFATDIHGSEVCLRKFLNAGKFYGCDTLIMGGDITVESALGHGSSFTIGLADVLASESTVSSSVAGDVQAAPRSHQPVAV